MNRWLKGFILICLAPIILAVILSVLLYVPAVQDFAVKKASSYAEDATGMQIDIGKIRLKYPFKLDLNDVSVLSAPEDTLLSLGHFRLRVQAMPLLRWKVVADAIELEDVYADTGELIDGIALKGEIGRMFAKIDPADLKNSRVLLSDFTLSDAAVSVLLNDTTPAPEDTASAPLEWVLDLQKINLSHVSVGLQMADSTRISSYIAQAQLRQGVVDLGKSHYSAAHFELLSSTLNYDANFNSPMEGIDPSHIALSDINICIDSLSNQGLELNALLKRFSAEERSGLMVKSLTGDIISDERQINIPALKLETGSSSAQISATVPWNSLEENAEEHFDANFNFSIGKNDILLLATALPEDFKKDYPNTPFMLQGNVSGNVNAIRLDKATGGIAEFFSLETGGYVNQLSDENRRNGNIQLKLSNKNLDFLLSFLPENMRSFYAIPSGMSLDMDANIEGKKYDADVLLRDGDGKVELKAKYDDLAQSYLATLSVDSLNPMHFMPKDSLYALSVSAQVAGRGTDIYSDSTHLFMRGNISDIHYGNLSVSDVHLSGSLKEHKVALKINSRYPLALLDVSLSGMLTKERVLAVLDADFKNLDLYNLHFTPTPLKTSFRLLAETEIHNEKDLVADVTLDDCSIETSDYTFRPEKLIIHADSKEELSNLSLESGDFNINLTGQHDFGTIAKKFADVSSEISQQMGKDSAVNFAALKSFFPVLQLTASAKQNNPIYSFMEMNYMDFTQFDLVANTSPEEGLHLNAALHNLSRDTLRIDTIRVSLNQDSSRLIYQADVVKNKYMQQPPFSAQVKGRLTLNSVDALLTFKDGADSTGVLFGAEVSKVPDGLKLHLFPEEPVIAYRKFVLNKDNFLLYRNEKEIEANISLESDIATAHFYSQQQEDTTAITYPSLFAELQQVDLGLISNAFPAYLPSMSGLLNATFQYVPEDTVFLVTADMNIDTLRYNDQRVGNLVCNAVYLPISSDQHQMDVHLFRDGREITNMTAGYYNDGTRDSINGVLSISGLPLEMITPFIPDKMASLSGSMDGNIHILGTSNKPDLSGAFNFDSASVYVGALASSIRLDSSTIRIADNRILFNRYKLYSAGDNPFVLDGNVDFSDMARMTADLRMFANNMQLLNVKRNSESLVYGKLLVNLNSTVKGPLDALVMRGDLQLLGSTDLTYVLKDSPLAVQDRLSDMVTFTSFADTLRHRRLQRPALPLGGMDMLMTIRIDQAVRLNADLTPDQSGRVELEGGGDLSFQYTPQGDMILNGRYSLSGGTLKYTLPLISLKDFNIQDGSYVQWNGNPMDPYLNLIATERIRTSVSLEGENSRMVNFDVGIILKQTLENLALQFTLEAPEDMAVQNQLAAMGEEERAKQAVSMMITGMYLAGSKSSGKSNMDMGAALNSFLQSEINNIAGSALKTIDISFGMESYDENGTDGGGKRTDYSFRFAKRFYNDRLRVVIGGRISTGNDINEGQNQSFIDNIAVEWRLDNSGTRYVKIFHNKNYESLLEGEISETGAGIVLRKKMKRLRELFIFRKNKNRSVKAKAEPDSDSE